MNIYNLYSGSWLSNCYVLVSNGEDGKNYAAVIDPSADEDEIVRFVKSKDAFVDKIILTHGHFDHIISLDALRDATGAAAYIHEDDAEMLEDSEKNAYSFFFGEIFSQRPAEFLLSDNDIIKLGNEELQVIHLPGHSKGSIALMGEGFLITGDTIFAEGFGRYDLYGGSPVILKRSLEQLKSYDKDLVICPGHGEQETLGKALSSIAEFI